DHSATSPGGATVHCLQCAVVGRRGRDKDTMGHSVNGKSPCPVSWRTFPKSALHEPAPRCYVATTCDFNRHFPSMVSANTELAYNSKIEGEVIVSRADAVINWIRSNSVWPMPMGLACCSI